MAGQGGEPLDEANILILADDYKMPESEFRARFSEAEIVRILTLRQARNVAHELLYPKK